MIFGGRGGREIKILRFLLTLITYIIRTCYNATAGPGQDIVIFVSSKFVHACCISRLQNIGKDILIENFPVFYFFDTLQEESIPSDA